MSIKELKKSRNNQKVFSKRIPTKNRIFADRYHRDTFTKTDQDIKEAINIIREKCYDFGPTFALQHL